MATSRTAPNICILPSVSGKFYMNRCDVFSDYMTDLL